METTKGTRIGAQDRAAAEWLVRWLGSTNRAGHTKVMLPTASVSRRSATLGISAKGYTGLMGCTIIPILDPDIICVILTAVLSPLLSAPSLIFISQKDE